MSDDTVSPTGIREATPEQVELMSHPVRWRAYGYLRGLGPQRPVDLVKRLAVSEAVLLHHLRLMRDGGIVQEVPGSSTAERYSLWEAPGGGLMFSGAVANSAYDQETVRRWLDVFVQAQNFILTQWAEEELTWSDEWRDIALNFDQWLHLTEAEAKEFTDGLFDYVRQWKRRTQERSASTTAADGEHFTPIYVATQAVPVSRE